MRPPLSSIPSFANPKILLIQSHAPVTIFHRNPVNVNGSSGSSHPKIPNTKLIAMLRGIITMSINRLNKLVSSSNSKSEVIKLKVDSSPPHILPTISLPKSYILPKNHASVSKNQGNCSSNFFNT